MRTLLTLAVTLVFIFAGSSLAKDTKHKNKERRPISVKPESPELVEYKVNRHCREHPATLHEEADRTEDYCRNGQPVTIQTRDGYISVAVGETKVFAVPKDNDYGKSGGWLWWCSNSGECSRLDKDYPADYVKVTRTKDGMIWVKVKIEGER